MHSLRTKLLIYTILFVFTSSSAILTISVCQSKKRGKQDIESIKSLENARVRNNLKEHVNVVYSIIEAHNRQALSQNEIKALLNDIQKLTSVGERRYFWIMKADTAPKLLIPDYTSAHVDSNNAKTDAMLKTVYRCVRDKGEGFCSITWPAIQNDMQDSSGTKLCYVRLYKPLNWVIVSGQYIDDMNDVIADRVSRNNTKIKELIWERILYSVLILLASTLLIILFSTMVTRPINKLVKFTQKMASGGRNRSARIDISSNDEIGLLARNFNSMLQRIDVALEKLAEKGRLYQELVENVNSAIIRINKCGKIVFVNKYLQHHMGLKTDEAIDNKILDDIVSQMNISSLLDVKQKGSEPDHYYVENEIVVSDDNRKWVAWSLRLIFSKEGSLKEILCVGNDITIRRNAEEIKRLQQMKLIQTDKMATLGNLVSGVAHEINNPNNFILLNAENLSDIWIDIVSILDEHYAKDGSYTIAGLSYQEMRSEIPALIRGITDGAQRIKKIVDSLKHFARQDPEEYNHRVNVCEVVGSACIILSNMIKNSTDKFTVIKKGHCFDVQGNFQRIEQVVINLLTNACQATSDKRKPITVTIDNQKNPDYVVVEVCDCGKGILPENMKHIMDPFFTTKRHNGGTGLGLFICYNIIKAHGGEIKIESNPGIQTIASITLKKYLML
jgi:PAS domain S-box-containing protein